MIIDGKKIMVLYGDSIMDAARRAGIYIPGLCYSEAMEHDNACRLCMVEINERGSDKLVAACAHDASEGLAVTTNSERVAKIRKTMLKLLYAQAPGNEVIVQLMKKYDVAPEKRLPEKEERNCILCGLCVQTCNFFVDGAISIVNRGIHKKVDTPYGEATEDCVGCATCALTCPIQVIECKDEGEKREIWNNQFELIHCEECGTMITTKENYYSGNNPDLPVLCHDCSENYRRKNDSAIQMKLRKG